MSHGSGAYCGWLTMKIKSNALPVDRSYFKITAIDPGLSIGVATVVLLHQYGNTWDAEFTVDTLQWPDGAGYLRSQVLASADVVIVEDWRLRAGAALSLVGSQLWGPFVEGFVIGDLAASNRPAPIFQSPAQAMHVAQMLGRTGVVTENEHEKDALKHLLVYLRSV
jgi:hypothetical protein